MSDQLAAIDIGTHSTRILIGRVIGEKIERSHKITSVTRLGEGLSESGKISDQASDRVLAVLRSYVSLAAEQGARLIRIVATSAVRDASNREHFLKQVEEATSLRPDLIPGEEEARLTYSGALSDLRDADNKRILVFDIGGGSTEFVWGQGNQPSEYWSTPVGCLRMRQCYLFSDPPLKNELAECGQAALDNAALPLSSLKDTPIDMAIATAGTATSLASTWLGLDSYEPDKVHHLKMNKKTVDELIDRLSGLSLEERRHVKGLEPERADVIVSGATILSSIMSSLNLTEILVSETDMLEGVLVKGAKPS